MPTTAFPVGPGFSFTRNPTTAPPPAPPYQSLLTPYNQNPQPTGGQGPYGLVPGTTPLPPSTFAQTTAAVPGLQPAGGQAASNVMSELQGELSPQTLKNLQDIAARFGISSGMPGSNAVPGSLAFNQNLLGNVETTQAEQAQGLKDYESLLGSVGAQQLPPGLISEIQQSNAQLAAAPDPYQAAQQQLQNYYNALNQARGPAAGTTPTIPTPASGTGTLAPNPFAPPPTPKAPPDGSYGFPGVPPGTVTTDTSSYFDPFSGFGGSEFLDSQYGSATTPDDLAQAYANPEDYYAGILASSGG